MKFLADGWLPENDIQTMAQVFYQNTGYERVNQIPSHGVCLSAGYENNGFEAVFYQDGRQVASKGIVLNGEDDRRKAKLCLYDLLVDVTGFRPPWGGLTGIRPTKILNELWDEGYPVEGSENYLMENYRVTYEKALFCKEIALHERDILKSNDGLGASLYAGVAFCPSKCLYCSFTSFPMDKFKGLAEPYFEAMKQELQYLGEVLKPFRLETVYVGGGTPSAPDMKQIEGLLRDIADNFDLTHTKEFTFEGGRPETLDLPKLRLLKEYGVNRISINPQTMNDVTLERIGRKHTAADFLQAYHRAAQTGHENINVDLILGLPGESVGDVVHTFQEISKISPKSVTVHTLAVKRASRLKEEFDSHLLASHGAMEEMLRVSREYCKAMGLFPYYMYRQKNMVGNFENVGYAAKGFEGIYNVQIMEEKQSIFAAGAGAVTKMVDRESNKIERAFNVKDIEAYINRIGEMIDRKRALIEGRKANHEIFHTQGNL